MALFAQKEVAECCCTLVRYDTVRAQHTVGPMGRSRDQDETLSPPPRHAEESGGAKVELSRDTTRTITRLQGQMCLLGVDTPTLVTW